MWFLQAVFLTALSEITSWQDNLGVRILNEVIDKQWLSVALHYVLSPDRMEILKL